MAYRVGDQCYFEQSEAAQAYCGALSGMTSSGFMRCNFAEWQDPAVFFTYTTLGPDGSEFAYSGTAYLSACTPPEPLAVLNLTAEDGFILSAAVIGVWASAFAIRGLIRALNVADTPASSD